MMNYGVFIYKISEKVEFIALTRNQLYHKITLCIYVTGYNL